MTEDEYRRAHPATIRMYDFRIDGFRDVTKEDILALVRRCREYDVPCTGIVDQANWDRIYDAVVAAFKKRRALESGDGN